MAKDPVCGMEVDESKASVQVTFKEKVYYLCSFECKDEFVKEPKKFVERVERGIL